MSIKKLLILLLLIFLVFSKSNAQYLIMKSDADSILMQSIDYTYNVDYNNAERLAKEVQKRYPDHPAGYFAEAISLWWQIMLDKESEQVESHFLKCIDEVIERCNKTLDTMPWDLANLFFKGGAIGYRGRYYAQKESWFRAATDGLAAYKILIQCMQIAPFNRDILLGIGYYDYFAVALPDKYPALKPLMAFAPNGDKKMGILQLKATAKSARYSGLEAKVMLLQIYYTFEKNFNEAFSIAKELFTQYPNNPYLHRYFGRCQVALGIADYERTWLEILRRCKNKQRGYDIKTSREGVYYYGTGLYNSGYYDRAIKYFIKCDEISKKIDKEVSGFRIQSNLKIGKIYDILKNRTKAIEYYKKVLTWSDNNGSRKEAENYVKRPFGN
jgi:tetratricopeptide (TPR) repeat protein